MTTTSTPILPISFKEFVKNPLLGVMFAMLLGMVMLYADNKRAYKEQIAAQEMQNRRLEAKVQLLEAKVDKLYGIIYDIERSGRSGRSGYRTN